MTFRKKLIALKHRKMAKKMEAKEKQQKAATHAAHTTR
jgi:hypothetical protein